MHSRGTSRPRRKKRTICSALWDLNPQRIAKMCRSGSLEDSRMAVPAYEYKTTPSGPPRFLVGPKNRVADISATGTSDVRQVCCYGRLLKVNRPFIIAKLVKKTEAVCGHAFQHCLCCLTSYGAERRAASDVSRFDSCTSSLSPRPQKGLCGILLCLLLWLFRALLFILRFFSRPVGVRFARVF